LGEPNNIVNNIFPILKWTGRPYCAIRLSFLLPSKNKLVIEPYENSSDKISAGDRPMDRKVGKTSMEKAK
jgi:hypothetical protein